MEIVNLRPDLVEQELLMASIMSSISRSSNDFEDQLSQYLTVEPNGLAKYKNFLNLWVKNYKHLSILDHANIHLRIKGLSQYLTKLTETFNLFKDLLPLGITEISTRYVDFSLISADDFYVDPLIKQDEELYLLYKGIINKQLNFYKDSVAKVKSVLGEKDKSCFDICRNLLPAGTPSDYNITLSFRSLKNWISKLFIAEDLTVVSELYEFLNKLIDILIKDYSFLFSKEEFEEIKNQSYFLYKSYLNNMNDYLDWDLEKINSYLDNIKIEGVSDNYLENKILLKECSIIQEKVRKALNTLSHCKDLSSKDSFKLNTNLFNNILNTKKYRDFDWEFDVVGVIDFGAYRDIARHRGLQFIVTPNVYDINKESYLVQHPSLFKYISSEIINDFYTDLFLDIKTFLDKYSLRLTRDANRSLRVIHNYLRVVLNYLLPMSVQKKVRIKGRLDQFIHLVQERTQPAGHENYKYFAKLLRDKIGLYDK